MSTNYVVSPTQTKTLTPSESPGDPGIVMILNTEGVPMSCTTSAANSHAAPPSVESGAPLELSVFAPPKVFRDDPLSGSGASGGSQAQRHCHNRSGNSSSMAGGLSIAGSDASSVMQGRAPTGWTLSPPEPSLQSASSTSLPNMPLGASATHMHGHPSTTDDTPLSGGYITPYTEEEESPCAETPLSMPYGPVLSAGRVSDASAHSGGGNMKAPTEHLSTKTNGYQLQDPQQSGSNDIVVSKTTRGDGGGGSDNKNRSRTSPTTPPI